MKLIHRIRRIRGQTEGLEHALQQEGDCAAVLQQIAALRGAVNGLMAEVLEDHLREHVATKGVRPSTRDINAVVRVVKSYLK